MADDSPRPRLLGLRWLPPLLIAAALGYTGWRYPALGEQVPLHWNFRGEADGFGPRQMIFVLPLLALALELVLGWLTGRPDLLNYPRPVTAENQARLHAAGQDLMVALRLYLAALFGSLCWASVATATGQLTRLHPAYLGFCLVSLVLLTAVFARRMVADSAAPPPVEP